MRCHCDKGSFCLSSLSNAWHGTCDAHACSCIMQSVRNARTTSTRYIANNNQNNLAFADFRPAACGAAACLHTCPNHLKHASMANVPHD